MADGILQYALKLENESFTRPLSTAQSRLSSFNSTAGQSSLAGLSAGFAGAGSVITAFAATVASAKANLESYAEFDGLVRGLKTLEGTSTATEARLAVLRDTAKAPGLGFEEAVRGDIRLRAVGMSADLSARSLKAFGNALATVGGGKSELDGVILALSQIEAKGSVSAEEINQIAERVPQVRAAMKAAFGTAAAEDIQKLSITSKQFIEGLVTEIEKLPQVTSGAQNTLDNYTDSWAELKTTSAEFFLGLSGPALDTASQVIQSLTRDLNRLKTALGIKTPGLTGKDSKGQEQKNAEEAAEAELKAQQATAESLRKSNAEIDAWQRAKDKERLALVAAQEEQKKQLRDQQLRQAAQLEDRYRQATLSREQYLIGQIARIRASGMHTKDDLKAFEGNLPIQLNIAERIAEIAAAEKELGQIRKTEAAQETQRRKAAAQEAEAAADKAAGLDHAKAAFALENQILAARAAGHEKEAKALERTARIEALKLQIMQQQGLSAKDALAAAQKRIALEEAASKPRRGLLNAAESAAARQARRSATDRARDERLGRNGLTNADQLALARSKELAQPGSNYINPARAAAQLAEASGSLTPREAKRQEKEEAARKSADPMYRAVKNIEERFKNLATA